MQRRRELLIAVGVAALGSMRADGEPAADGSRAGNPLDLGEFGKRKEPIFITSDNLEYDYKTNVVVYHGDVHAIQGPVTLRSDTLTITLEKTDQDGSSDAPKSDPPRGDSPKSNPRLRQIVAAGHVHMDDGTRSATGGRAVFEQSERTVVLTENPVLHEGSNEVVGDRVVVYLDENRSIVEGGRKRVKAVLYPSKDSGLTPAGTNKEGEHAPGKQDEQARVEPGAPTAGPPASGAVGGAPP